MKWFFLGLGALFMLKNDMKVEIKDKGDCWNCIYRNLSLLSKQNTRAIFFELLKSVDRFNEAYGVNVRVFETARSKERQKRLVAGGVSWVSNIETAPHVERRAIDLVVFDKNGLWVWDKKILSKLHRFLRKDFPYWSMLRTGGNFRTNKDYPHYEIKRSIWLSWSETNG